MIKFLKSLLPDLFAVMGFVAIAFIYFSPVIEGKVLPQSDMIQVRGMQKELVDYHKLTGKDAMWTNSMFGGMPAYQIRGGNVFNIFHELQWPTRLYLPYFTVGILFVYLFGFYLLLRILKIDVLLAFAGAIGFAFASYNLIIIFAGHITKAYAIGYMAPVIAGIILLYDGKYLSGGLITLVSLGIQISCNHYQITYYLILTIGLFILFKAAEFIKLKDFKKWIISTSVFTGVTILAVIPNSSMFWSTYEYGKYSTRGPSELTADTNDQTSGLNKSYILNDYSYGISETLNLLIPNFMGGPSVAKLPDHGKTYELLRKSGYPEHEIKNIISRMPTYHGPQRFTAGPAYIGAVSIFLFILACYFLQGTIKLWLLTALAFSITLAWGKHIPVLSGFFIDYFPGYDKFRTVSMILVIAGFIIPFGAILGFHKLLTSKNNKKHSLKSLKYSYFIAGGICLFFGLIGYNILDYSSSADQNMPPQILEALKADRATLLRNDAFRSFGLITAGAVLIYAWIKNKLSLQYLLLSFSVLFLADLWPVDKRYLNNSNFISKRADKELISPTPADLEILKDSTYFRVLNLSLDPFNDATTSYFHKSLGGYHGAKLKKYQEIIERLIARSNMNVINMLNTKYFIKLSDDRTTINAILNQDALGNAWFVDSILMVNSADEEIDTLNNFNPATSVVIQKKYSSYISQDNISPADSSDYISLISYAPDELHYKSKTSGERFAVFSEVFYPKGWKVFIDGSPAEYINVDYILRGMKIPPGEHNIQFIFRPDSYIISSKISEASSIVIILLVLGGVFYGYRNKKFH